MKPLQGYLTPDELVHKYSRVESVLGWNASKVGTFFSAGLLHGHRKFFKSYIAEKSFLELVQFVNTVSIKKQLNFDAPAAVCNLLTPEELMEKYEQVLSWGWSASKIGTFFSSGLLLGHRNGKEYKALIIETSFLDLMDYVNIVAIKRQLKY
jgi:hypothetical protein